ncbi:MAG: hypothetical protein JW913_17210 [Chitinispirillaceae bacterium]|nr:hypothetical protein [Chitinispirillaceae bacterium]
MNRLLKLILTGSIIVTGFIGCGLLDATEESTPEITINSIGSIDVGTFKNVTGKVTAGEAITSIAYTITDASDNDVSTITVSGPSSSSEDKIEFKDNDAIKITVGNNAVAADYKLKITVTAGSTVDATFNFTVSGSGGTAVETVTLDAGANQNSTLGSSIDLDGGDVWLSAQAANNVSKIDICYSHTSSGGDKVGSPYWAQESDYNYAKDWSNPPQTKIIKLSMTSAEFDAVTTKEAIEAKWSGTEVISLAVVEGDVFIVKTTEDAYALVRITDQVAGETGKITIKVAR